MSDAIKITWTHDPSLMRSSLNAWWESAVPRPSISWRLIFWCLVWIGLLAAAIVLGALGLDPAYVLAGLAGIAVFIIGFFTLQRVRMRAFYRALGQHWATAGNTHAEFSATGMILTDTVSDQRFGWGAIDAIAAGPKATVLRIGISMVAIPDAALPDGMSPAAFRQTLSTWRTGIATGKVAA